MDKNMINYDAYLKVCRDAVNDDDVFKTFKRHLDYMPILEHVTYDQGLVYIEEIRRVFPHMLHSMDRFSTNDNVGKPYRRYYPELRMEMSPTTLRYVKVLCDLLSIFGKLTDLDIIEIGGGYGGQCKIIHDAYKPKSYTIVDLPEALSLSDKYLKTFGVTDVILRNADDQVEKHYDLCISNYAFTEIARNYQEIYAAKIIRHSSRGYMTCNFIVPENLSRSEILALKSNYEVYEERPLTAGDNFIYVWQ
jgi:hypothetical protein